MFIPMSPFVCVEYVDTQDYLQATPVSEYFKNVFPETCKPQIIEQK
jgi:hypothetical protein